MLVLSTFSRGNNWGIISIIRASTWDYLGITGDYLGLLRIIGGLFGGLLGKNGGTMGGVVEINW